MGARMPLCSSVFWLEFSVFCVILLLNYSFIDSKILMHFMVCGVIRQYELIG